MSWDESHAEAQPGRRPLIHLWSCTALTFCRDSSAAWLGIRTRGDKLKGKLGRRGLELGPSHKHTTWKLEGPFCLESRGQLSVCPSVSALSAHCGRCWSQPGEQGE